MALACCSTSAADFASLTPPALPRPPAWTWALTTQRSPPSAAAADFASSGVVATWPCRHRNAVLGKQSLRLILVQIHRKRISSHVWRAAVFSTKPGTPAKHAHHGRASADQVEFGAMSAVDAVDTQRAKSSAASSSQLGHGRLRLARPRSAEPFSSVRRRGVAGGLLSRRCSAHRRGNRRHARMVGAHRVACRRLRVSASCCNGAGRARCGRRIFNSPPTSWPSLS